ncbi:hypothetical protein [Reinekea thalattae]|uniref:hypothetical protein n=1 Tax=Reinekea thalattae TaxID=2593301 RepID=UPI00164EDBEB|nr:hypothetical protein [Reinekea thalattae]
MQCIVETSTKNKPTCAYDRKRMEIALKSEKKRLPKGLSISQMREFILASK